MNEDIFLNSFSEILAKNLIVTLVKLEHFRLMQAKLNGSLENGFANIENLLLLLTLWSSIDPLAHLEDMEIEQ